MSDRELLELAAKAAGMEVIRSRLDDPMFSDFLLQPVNGIGVGWNPLTDDGDEARLEAALCMAVRWWGNCVTVCNDHRDFGATEFFADHGGDKQAARRRAGVVAAAEIGKAMP